jgi:hypothetical protein
MRDFDPTYEHSGSVSRLLAEATPPFMSAMPPIATKAMSRSETSLCADFVAKLFDDFGEQ